MIGILVTNDCGLAKHISNGCAQRFGLGRSGCIFVSAWVPTDRRSARFKGIEAKTEEEARKLLVQEGGLSILADDTLVDTHDYEMAECIDES